MIYFTVWQPKKSIFAFVYQNCNTKLFECHAFDCQTKFNVIGQLLSYKGTFLA